jgi:hypothetical protein
MAVRFRQGHARESNVFFVVKVLVKSPTAVGHMGCKARKGARAGSEILPLILLRGSSPRHPTSVRIVEENHCFHPRCVGQLNSVRGCSRGSTLGGEL